MTKKIVTNKISSNLLSISKDKLSDTYYSFFEHAPISLWIEDFSKLKTHIDTIAKENNTDAKSYIKESSLNSIQKLATLVTIKDVNSTTLKLYKAKTKQELFSNLDNTFTESSGIAFSKLLTDVLLGAKVTEIETVNKTLEGDEFDIAIKFKVVEGSENTLDTIIVSVENITERIKARKALALSEKRYRAAQEASKTGSWEFDFSTKKTHWSDEAYKLIGFKPEKQYLTPDFYLKYVHADDRHLANDFSVDFLLKNPNQNLNYRIITHQGELKYLNEKRTAVIKNGRILKIIGICHDVTESVLSEQKLNTTKNLFSKTLSSIKDGFVILDYNSNYLYVNEQASNLLGRSSEELIGKHIWTEFPEKEGDTFFDNYQEALETRKPISFENYFEPWGRWFENRIIPSSEGMLLFFHEITNKKSNENKLKTAYNIINNSASVSVLCKNEWDFPVEFASENTIDLLGYKHVDFLNSNIKIYEVLHSNDIEFVGSEILKFSKGIYSDRHALKPFRIITKQGEVKWLKVKLEAIRNQQNILTHIQGIGEDITEQKRTEDLFIISNQRIQDQFNNTPLASIIWDLDFNVLEWNNSAQRIFGYTAEEAIGYPIKDLITPPHLVGEMKNILEKLLVQKEGFRNTNENVTKNGKIITCSWYNVGLKDVDGKVIGMASLVDDITERVNSKIIIENSEKKYRAIFEKSADAVFILKNDVFVDCNEASLKMFGYSSKEVLFQIHPSKVSPKQQRDGSDSAIKAEEMINLAIENGSHRFRWCHQHKNGEIFPAEVSLTKINDIDSQPTIHAVVKDISDKVKNEELEKVVYNISKAALTINDFSEFGLFIKNELHKIIDTSNFYIALYNEITNMFSTPCYTDEKEDITEFSANNTLTGYVLKTKKSLLVNGNSHTELISKGLVHLVGEDSKIWVGVPLKINEEVFGVIVVQSYENKNAYNESDVQLLEFVANQISTTIQRKNAENELKIALNKAQESDKLKSSFLANMSHEIRTPMNGIIGFSELFLEDELSPKERRKYAKIVINSSKQLLSIVNDILDISKIEAGAVQLHYESINLNKLLEELYNFYKPKANASNLQLNCVKGLKSFDSLIEIDQTKLNQVLTNLLSNAFKFTEEGSIEFGYQLIDSNLQFYVKDTGVGIEKDIQDKIFDRFIQANIDISKKLQGTGLGLAISKKFVELFGGKIWIDSNAKGTTINFTIPYIKSKLPIITSVVEEQKPALQVKDKELTILVAEDEEYNMMFINELFSKTNFKLIEADNGKKAVELSQSNPEIDLVLMDIKMPIMDGNEAMKLIKKDRPKLPIVALSAFAMESDKKIALEKGFDAYLTKPIDKKLLFSIIGKYTI
ncbi:MAG: PAS domain S-box protein [Lutibacter sp.]|uniref:PAS domain S-box protein n=1 Tax=Lutibacter sp. TaxID=1925666 RepID=UPI001A02440C|nr:PAS domain S-box protein [Lutibacter sp.]NOR28775.1 PAS domain S-box protein [Lutibacter sp.]